MTSTFFPKKKKQCMYFNSLIFFSISFHFKFSFSFFVWLLFLFLIFFFFGGGGGGAKIVGLQYLNYVSSRAIMTLGFVDPFCPHHL